MSVEEADACSRRIIDLYGDMIRFVDSVQENLPLQAQDQPTVPPFLIKAN